MLLPTSMVTFRPGKTLEIVGRARAMVRVVSLFVPSHEAIDFEVLDVVIRPREIPQGQTREASERSLFQGEGAVHCVLFNECNFRAPALVTKPSEGNLLPTEEVVARVRRVSGNGEGERHLHLAFELGEA